MSRSYDVQILYLFFQHEFVALNLRPGILINFCIAAGQCNFRMSFPDEIYLRNICSIVELRFLQSITFSLLCRLYLNLALFF